MREEALIIFVRKPELGKVKTRLAAAVGAEAALMVYCKMLEHTRLISADLPCDKYVFYAGAIEEDDLWRTGYYKLLQQDTDLGKRMKTAFAFLFNKGYQRVCIIGSDCFELTSAIIRDAFRELQNNDVVIGPARDGGYYLLGMQGLKEIFDGIAWSTGEVLAQTTQQLLEKGCRFSLLPLLTDVDTVDDLPQSIAFELKQSANKARMNE